jgi:hypothetical protein
MMGEQQIIDEIARKAQSSFGPGLYHGDLGLSYETYAAIVEFTLCEVGLVNVGAQTHRMGRR